MPPEVARLATRVADGAALTWDELAAVAREIPKSRFSKMLPKALAGAAASPRGVGTGPSRTALEALDLLPRYPLNAPSYTFQVARADAAGGQRILGAVPADDAARQLVESSPRGAAFLDFLSEAVRTVNQQDAPSTLETVTLRGGLARPGNFAVVEGDRHVKLGPTMSGDLVQWMRGGPLDAGRAADIAMTLVHEAGHTVPPGSATFWREEGVVTTLATWGDRLGPVLRAGGFAEAPVTVVGWSDATEAMRALARLAGLSPGDPQQFTAAHQLLRGAPDETFNGRVAAAIGDQHGLGPAERTRVQDAIGAMDRAEKEREVWGGESSLLASVQAIAKSLGVTA